MKRWLTFLCAVGLLNGCVSLNSVSLTQIPKDRRKLITAENSRIIVLGFNFNNDYVNPVTQRLMDKCPGGQVKGILTKDELTDYFLFIVVKRSITAQGYCVES